MIFQVAGIEFDLGEDPDEMIAYDADELACETIGQTWEAENEEDLVDKISVASGWSIKSIDYRIVLT